MDMHCIDKEGNDTLPLFPITEMRKLGMIVDYGEDSISFKTNPSKWRKLPRTKKGLLLPPLAEEAVARFQDGEEANLASSSSSTH